MSATLLIRASGVLLMLASPHPVVFVAAAVLLSIGNQALSPAHGAIIATLVEGRDRDAALAFAYALRNAGPAPAR